MPLISYEEYEKQPLLPKEQQVYDSLVSLNSMSIRHILVKLMGKDSKQISIITNVQSGKKRLEIDWEHIAMA